jgi:hypothetical protein
MRASAGQYIPLARLSCEAILDIYPKFSDIALQLLVSVDTDSVNLDVNALIMKS